MSVIIKGMVMPENCWDCPLCDSKWCYAKAMPLENGLTTAGRQEGCPLIELPPHGRLIDADQLLSIWEGDRKSIHEAGIEYCEESYDSVIDSFAWDVKKIKTFVEAEE